MPVTVNVPIKISVDPEAVTEQYSWVEETLTAAAGRALKNSRDVVLAERGGYLGIKIHRPEVIWRGGGLPEVPEAIRRQIEEHLEVLVASLVEGAGVYDFAHASKKAPSTIPEEVAEPIDSQRTHSLLGVYELPSFDDGGNTTFFDFEHDEPDVVTPFSGELRRVWQRIDRNRIQDPRLFSRFLRWVDAQVDKQLSSQTNATYIGAIFRIVGGWVVRFRSRSGGDLREYTIGEFHRYFISGSGPQGRWETRIEEPPPALTIMRHVGPAADREQRARVARSIWADGIRQEIRSRATRPPNMSQDVYEAQLERKVEEEIQRRLDDFPENTASIIEMNIGGALLYIAVPEGHQWEGEAYLLPFQREIEVSSEESEDGGSETRVGTPSEGDRGVGGEGGGGGGRVEGGSGQGEGRRGIIFSDEQAEGQAGAFYPPSRYTSTGSQDCSPLLGEPPLDELGEDGIRLQSLIEEIANLLQIQPCGHAARFCVNAALALGARAAAVADYAVSEAGFSQPMEAASGNLGVLEFIPTASPAIQFMRHLARITPLITRLSNTIIWIYSKAEYKVKIKGTWHANPTGWSLHFLHALTPSMKASIGFIFGMTCQVVLLQLLRSSHSAIEARLNIIDTYAEQFETLIVPQLKSLEEFQDLRERLKDFQNLADFRSMTGSAFPARRTEQVALVGMAPHAAWLIAAQEVTAALKTDEEAPIRTEGSRGEIIVDENHTVRIWDGQGRLWTLNELERAIVIRRGVIEGVDPLIKQLIEIDEVLERFRNSSNGVRIELERLLQEMKANNEEKTVETEESWEFAFRASKINKHIPSATIPYTRFNLQGIHLQAHQQIGEFFQGDRFYGEGINSLFSAELGRQSLTNFFEFTGLILLSILCPPLGVVAGVATSAVHLSNARGREQLFESLIDPELVLSRAEVEAELFAAHLGFALSFIPNVRSIARVGAVGSRAVLRRGVVRGARLSFRLGQRATLRAMRENLKHGVIVAFVREVATDQFMDQLITKIIEPIIQRIEREVAITGPQGGLVGAERTLQRLATVETTPRTAGSHHSEEGEGSHDPL